MAAHLCLPSPCCQGQLGKPTGYKNRQGNPTYVDTSGDRDISATLCHDTWWVLHNDIKVAIEAENHKARVESGLFRDIIPAGRSRNGGRGELETVRGRSGCLGSAVSLSTRPPDYHPPRGPRPAPAQAGEPEPAP